MLFTKAALFLSLASTLVGAVPGDWKKNGKDDKDCDVKKPEKPHKPGKPGGGKKQPNIVLILTDDQDKRTTMFREYLPRIFKHLVDEGVSYEHFFSPVSICCPARVSLLRAQHAHNHNITFVNPPYGGWDLFNEFGYVNHTIADFLQQAGYDTYYVGKYMNGHSESNCVELPVSGFTSSDMSVDPWTYDYWSPGFSRDNQEMVLSPGVYSGDFSAQKTLAYLDTALANDKPFFIGYSPLGPHTWADGRLPLDKNIPFQIPEGPPRAAYMFPTAELPRVETWNPDEPLGVSWVKTLPKLNRTVEAYFDDFYRGRLRAMQPIDEFVEDLVEKLREAGELDNTYIMLTSDNGFAMGTHRRQPGKTLGMEDDINVPMVIRGPGIPRGKVDDISLYNMVDLAETIMRLGGAKSDYENDGVMMNLHQNDKDKDGKTAEQHKKARHSISEYWVQVVEEGIFSNPWRDNNTYRTLRVADETTGVSYSYSVWCTGERELYDLNEDPHQARNLMIPLNNAGEFAAFDIEKDGQSILSEDMQRLMHRLDGLLLVLKTCKGDTCRDPYAEMFASLEKKPTKLSDTMDSKYDAYFASLPKVRFDTCTLGFHLRLELPVWEHKLAY